MTAALDRVHPCTRGSAIILIVAILTLLTVLCFGILQFTADQRGWSRFKHEESILKQALISGRDHARSVLNDGYETRRATSAVSHLDQDWMTIFRPVGADSWPRFGDPAYPTAASRQARRQQLANGPWGEANAIDLWRFEPGLASPIVTANSEPHGHDDGFTSHDGTGRWFTAAWFDRGLRPVPKSKASLQLRYAVAIIDLSGLILANKARYEHLTIGGAPLVAGVAVPAGGSSTAAAGWSLERGEGVLPPADIGPCTAAWTVQIPDVPLTGVPCTQTDLPLGADDDALGYDQVRYNTWRPIPADHAFSAHMLMELGFGLDDSGPRTLADGWTFRSVHFIKGKPYQYGTRSKGNLPDSWRGQGYREVNLKYWQSSRRFGDFLPFAQNPHPVMGGNPWKTDLKGVFSSVPGIGINRHPAALLALINQDLQAGRPDPASGTADPYTLALEEPRRRWADAWNQIDYINWRSLQQGLRLHAVITPPSDLVPNRPSKASGLTQCWSPFGAPGGRFGSLDLRTKNDYEMRYQWTPDVNTAPPRVLEALVRLAVPYKPDSTVYINAESRTQTDRDAYDAFIQAIVGRIIARRPFTSWSELRGGSKGPFTWTTLADASIQNMLQSCVAPGPAPGRIGCLPDISAPGQPPASPGLPGQGIQAHFEIANWESATGRGNNASGLAWNHLTDRTAVVVKGRHLNRFWTDKAAGAADRGDAEYHFYALATDTSQWLDDAGKVAPRLRVERDSIVLVPAAATAALNGGGVNTITITTPGSGYGAVTVALIGGGGSGATAKATLGPSGSIINVNVINGGSGYTSAPAVVFTDTVRPTVVEYVTPASSPNEWTIDPDGEFTRIWFRKPPAAEVTSDANKKPTYIMVHYPGISLTVGNSRWFRIAVRAQLRDLDVPAASRDLSLETVIHLDPDRSGNVANTNGLWDSDIPYQDFENALQFKQSNGVIVW